FSSLNLGAAVQVLTYEVRMAWLAAAGQPSKVEKEEVASTKSGELATMDELERFYEHLEQTQVVGQQQAKPPAALFGGNRQRQ
ncbi:hypothetical protein Q5O12_27585, partial [Klebsiella pneumoniae]|nr:hypothetical protein [Klebsiella pneumoniae]